MTMANQKTTSSSCPYNRQSYSTRNGPNFNSYCKYFILVIFVIQCTNLVGEVGGTISIISQITEQVIGSIVDTPALAMPETMVDYGIDGYVVYSDPPEACSKVKSPPKYPEDVTWILLAKYSILCDLPNITENAWIAGYTGLIIHNVGSNSSEDMNDINDPHEPIVYTCFIGAYDGQVLKENYSYPADKSFKTFVRVRHRESSKNKWLILLVAILVIICSFALLVVPVLMLLKALHMCVSKIRKIRRRRLRASIINKFPITEWSDGDHDQYSSCVICIDDFEPHDRIRVLPCSHGFHVECIDPWLSKCKKFCPICKRKVIITSTDLEQQQISDESDDETTPLLRERVRITPTTSPSSSPTSINSTTAPVTATAATTAMTSTVGNTFVPQSENPFRRALRFKERRAAARQRRMSPLAGGLVAAAPNISHSHHQQRRSPSSSLFARARHLLIPSGASFPNAASSSSTGSDDTEPLLGGPLPPPRDTDTNAPGPSTTTNNFPSAARGVEGRTAGSQSLLIGNEAERRQRIPEVTVINSSNVSNADIDFPA